MDVSINFVCPCRPDFVYKNGSTFSNHKHSKTHLAWQTERDIKNDRLRSKEFENENERLKNRLLHKEEIEKELLNRIRTLEQERDYFQNQILK